MVKDGVGLVKRGPMELVTIANRKINKRNEIELILLTDQFIYAKPAVDRKGFLLQVPRTLIMTCGHQETSGTLCTRPYTGRWCWRTFTSRSCRAKLMATTSSSKYRC